jgi:hypothetical protein
LNLAFRVLAALEKKDVLFQCKSSTFQKVCTISPVNFKSKGGSLGDGTTKTDYKGNMVKYGLERGYTVVEG